MILLDTNIILNNTLNEKYNKIIEEHIDGMSKKNQSSEYYASNRNANKSRISDNIGMGKKSELLVNHFFNKEMDYPLMEIDFEIRQGKQKDWMPDLNYNQLDTSLPTIHVKSCDSFTISYMDDFSWTFQWNNKFGAGGRDKLFQNSYVDDICAFVYLDNWKSNQGKILVISTFRDVIPYLTDPKKESLKGLKKCLNFSMINLDIADEYNINI